MKTNKFSFWSVTALFLLSATASSQQKAEQAEAGVGMRGLAAGQVRPMTVAFAEQLIAAAKKSSCSPPAGSCSGAFAVVDDAGVLVSLEIIDGVLAAAPELAIKKARTPALWRRPTQAFLDAVNNGTNTTYMDGTYPDVTTSPGGIPLVKDGKIVGGFGIAGVGNASKQIDDAVLAEATKIFGKQ